MADEIPNGLRWYLENQDELGAPVTAADGNPEALAASVEVGRTFTTEGARAIVAARFRGKKKSGQKRTVAQLTKEVIILGLVRGIQTGLDCGEQSARKVLLERHADLTDNEDTLKTYLRRAKLHLKRSPGRGGGSWFRNVGILNLTNEGSVA